MKRFIKIIEIFRYHIQISMQNIIFGHTLPLKQNQLAFFLPAWLFHCRPLPLRCWLSQTWSVSWWCTQSVYLLPYLHHRRCPILSLSRQTLQSWKIIKLYIEHLHVYLIIVLEYFFRFKYSFTWDMYVQENQIIPNWLRLNIFKNIMLDGGVTPLLQRLPFSSQKGRWEILCSSWIQFPINHDFHFNMSIDTLYIFDSLPKACPSDGECGTSPCPPTDRTDPCDVSGLWCIICVSSSQSFCHSIFCHRHITSWSDSYWGWRR